MNVIGFGIQKCRAKYKEEMNIMQYAIIHDIPYKFCKNKEDIPVGYIPVGSVEFVSNSINNSNIIPDYYPLFLNEYLHRKVWKTNKWPSDIDHPVFIKPSDRYKRFNGFVVSDKCKKRRGPFWCSDVVNFINEWRYYISNSMVVAAEWYKGDEINEPDAPQLNNIKFPTENYCAALDFGEFETGEFALIEAQAPFACGWYGKDYKIYSEWIINGWNYISKST